MKSFLSSVRYFCIILVPIIIQGNCLSIKETLDGIAERGGNIDNIFKPSEGGYLGSGRVGITYKGELLTMKKEVAMKFISDELIVEAENEYETYFALNAVNNTNNEVFGIPTLYHYGQWENYIMIAVTLLDSKFAKRSFFDLNVVDILILFREWVRISKFIHSRGICHNDPHLGNMMFRGHRSFLIDYDRAIDTKHGYETSFHCAKRDWRIFLFDIAFKLGVDINWANESNPIEKFQNIQPDGLKKVFCEFAMTTYEDAKLEYNKVYTTINQQIERYYGDGTALVSWLTIEEGLVACTDLSMNPLPSIESIH